MAACPDSSDKRVNAEVCMSSVLTQVSRCRGEASCSAVLAAVGQRRQEVRRGARRERQAIKTQSVLSGCAALSSLARLSSKHACWARSEARGDAPGKDGQLSRVWEALGEAGLVGYLSLRNHLHRRGGAFPADSEAGGRPAFFSNC